MNRLGRALTVMGAFGASKALELLIGLFGSTTPQKVFVGSATRGLQVRSSAAGVTFSVGANEALKVGETLTRWDYPGGGSVTVGNVPSFGTRSGIWLGVASGAEAVGNTFVQHLPGTGFLLGSAVENFFFTGAALNFRDGTSTIRAKIDAQRASFTFGASTGSVVFREHPSLPLYGTIWLGVSPGSETVNNYALTGTGVTTLLKATTIVQLSSGVNVQIDCASTKRADFTGDFLRLTPSGTGTTAFGNVPGYTDRAAVWFNVAAGTENAFNSFIQVYSGSCVFGQSANTLFVDGASINLRDSTAAIRLKVDTSRVYLGNYGTSSGAIFKEWSAGYAGFWLGTAPGSETTANAVIYCNGSSDTYLSSPGMLTVKWGGSFWKVEQSSGISLFWYRRAFTVTTGDATVTTIATVPVGENSCETFIANWVGKSATTGNHLIKREVFTVRRKLTAAPSQLGTSHNEIAASKDDATWGTPDWTITGNDVVFRVTGKAATSIVWTLSVERTGQ